MTAASERLCLALDFPSRGEVLEAAARFAGRVGWMKIGLEAFLAEGPSLVKEVAGRGARVFLDLKLHDIPATVERAVSRAVACGASMVNVHALGGRAMLEAARRGIGDSPVTLVAVTLLTSLDSRALADLPLSGHPEGIARRLAVLAKECGLAGVVCAATDLPAVRGACGPAFVTVVPGIRSAGADILSLVNTFVGMAIDPESGQPRLSFGTGGLSGPAIRPLAVRMVFQVARALPGVPVMGIGGISELSDVLEFLAAGAAAVQVGTANFKDPGVSGRLVGELDAYCRRRGIVVSDLVGRALEAGAPVLDAGAEG